MTAALLQAQRNTHPMDMIEHLATINDWTFERSADDEISISVSGGWTDYNVTINWQDDLETLHLACMFELRVPEVRIDEAQRLIARINEQLWIGHFDLWHSEGALMYRHGQLFAGGSAPTAEQCEALMQTAIETCERYYQSFQFVLWAGKAAEQALEASLFETVGQA